MLATNNISYLENIIIEKITSIKKSLNHKRIAFSKIENYSVSKGEVNKINYLLSIVLNGDFVFENMDLDLEEITEIVIDVMIIKSDTIDILMDLSYGNGIIIKEVALKNINMKNDSFISKLNNLFFNTINVDLYDALDLLKKIR